MGRTGASEDSIWSPERILAFAQLLGPTTSSTAQYGLTGIGLAATSGPGGLRRKKNTAVASASRPVVAISMEDPLFFFFCSPNAVLALSALEIQET